MDSLFTTLVFIKNEPIRILPTIANFKKEHNLIFLMDFEDTLSQIVLEKENQKFVRKPKDFISWDLKKQEKWVLNQSDSDFVLIVYASMFFPQSLLSEFEKVAKSKQYDAVFQPLICWSHNRLVQLPFLYKKSTSCHFFNKSAINSNNSAIHFEFSISEKSKILRLPPLRKFSINVFRDDDLDVVIQKHLGYAERESIEKFQNASKITLSKLIFVVIKSFFWGYLKDGGFKSGIEGFIYHFNFAVYKFFVCTKIWEKQNNLTFENIRINHSKIRMKLIESENKLI